MAPVVLHDLYLNELKPIMEEADDLNGLNCVMQLDVIADLLRNLTDKQKQMFRQSIFAFLLYLDPRRLQLVRNILWRQVDLPSNEEMWFKLRKTILKFGKPEWALISGLKFDGQMIQDCDLPSGERLKDMYFPNLHNGICKRMMRETFCTLTQISDDNCVKLALAYASDHLFLARDLRRNIDPFILKIVDHTDLFNKHPWGLVTYKFTLTALQKAVNTELCRVRKKKSVNPDQKRKLKKTILLGYYAGLCMILENLTPSKKLFPKRRRNYHLSYYLLHQCIPVTCGPFETKC